MGVSEEEALRLVAFDGKLFGIWCKFWVAVENRGALS